MTLIPSSNRNANLAVSLYTRLLDEKGWGASEAWLAVSKLLVTCEIFCSGHWEHFHELPVLLESNVYKPKRNGEPNADMQDAAAVATYLAGALSTPVETLCAEIGLYFKQPSIRDKQPNNLRGHAFRSIVAATLDRFGDPELEIIEEKKPRDMFPGYEFGNRSKAARIDIVVLRRRIPVALLTTRWTYRHDRVDIIDEARAYMPAARNLNSNCRFYGVTAEFNPARLQKVIEQGEPLLANPAVTRLVHLKPELARETIGNNGALKHMIGLDDLVNASFDWQ